MDNKPQVYCKNNKKTLNIDFGTTILDVYDKIGLNLPYQPLCAYVNNRREGLNFRIFGNKQIEFLDYTRHGGRMVYMRSLFFVLWKAVEELFPGVSLVFEASISNGYLFNIGLDHEVTLEEVKIIRHRMRDIVEQDIRFHRVECTSKEAIELFRQKGLADKANLLETSGALYSFYYTLGDTIDYYYGPLVPSTGYLKSFDLVKYYKGLFLQMPEPDHPDKFCEIEKQEKMLNVFKQEHELQKIIEMSNVGDLNRSIQNGQASDLIKVSEALQEKRISDIADEIKNRGNVKIVLIAGPSSSGKTTFSKRLSIQLMANGLKPYPISLDDYFIDRDKTPKDENGEFDFESIYALDLDFFNKQLNKILEGEEVELPTYNFHTGSREFKGKKFKLSPNMILIFEGIHALNPMLTANLPEETKYRIYVSALTTIRLDDHNYIPTTDNRLIRRMVRDYKYRGVSATDTIKRWPSVRAGEEKWIFPYQENADAMFNSALLFELAVFKDRAIPILNQVREDSEQYSTAYHLLTFFKYINSLSEEELPPTSLLREFLGGSSFKY